MNFFYQADNALIDGTTKYDIKNIYAQCVDIEVWAGQPFAVDWSKVNGCFFMAEHIKQYVQSKTKIPCKTRLIKPGINLEKWFLKPLEPSRDPIKRLAYITGNNRIWDVKRLDIAFWILKDLMRLQSDIIWQLHIRGTYSRHVQYNRYCQHLEKDLGLEPFVVWHEERVDDLNKWLDDKDYFILPSTKEAFSYATAETMAKGIKPVLGNWEGCKDTWGGYANETYLGMLERILEDEYEPKKYRKFVEDNYDEKRYFREVDDFIGIK